MRITQGVSPLWATFGILHTLRSPSEVCAASISDFCLDDEPCQASPAIGEGALGVVRVCRMVNEGWSVAIKIEPLRYLESLSMNVLARGRCFVRANTHPIAKVLQSAAGARAVMGSKMVLAEMCSEVEGSKRMMLPRALPFSGSVQYRRTQRTTTTHQRQHCHFASRKRLESDRMTQIEPPRRR